MLLHVDFSLPAIIIVQKEKSSLFPRVFEKNRHFIQVFYAMNDI
jgi:hypothetical protein